MSQTDDCAFARHAGAADCGALFGMTGHFGTVMPEVNFRMPPWSPLDWPSARAPSKPTRLQPNQLAWCAANVPGFVDLLAERADG